MTTKQPTDGRWYAKQGMNQMVSGDTTVAMIPPAYGDKPVWFVFADTEHHGDAEADAHLIAASKVLLAALQGFEAWWRLPNTERTVAAIEPTISAALDAIAAAQPYLEK